MEKLVVAVLDDGKMYKAQYVARHDEKFVKTDSLYLDVSNVTFDHILKALNSGQNVYIPKGIVGEVVFSDVEYEIPDEVTMAQNLVINNERKKFDWQLATISALEVANFIMISNEFAAEGMFITNDNRDDIYLEVVTSGDDVKIQKLSRYLDCMDAIKNVDIARQRMNKFEEFIREAKSLEEINEIVERFNAVG